MTAERKAAGTVALTSKWGSVVTVPAADEEKYINAGFARPQVPEPADEPDAPETVEEAQAPVKKPATKK